MNPEKKKKQFREFNQMKLYERKTNKKRERTIYMTNKKYIYIYIYRNRESQKSKCKKKFYKVCRLN